MTSEAIAVQRAAEDGSNDVRRILGRGTVTTSELKRQRAGLLQRLIGPLPCAVAAYLAGRLVATTAELDRRADEEKGHHHD